MTYPRCLTESETIERALKGANLARYGDGEFRICQGGNCASQSYEKSLAIELRAILEKSPAGCLPCLPNPYGGTPRKASWLKYERAAKLGDQEYGSAFITRPDSAPWIDTAQYWERIRDLWRDKDVVLVKGSERSLRLGMMKDAKSVREVWGCYANAYRSRTPHRNDRPDCIKDIDGLMDAVGKPSGTVLLCLGATATVMAARLAKIGVHAVDVGHLGMFMRHAGIYSYKPDQLLSPEYRALMVRAHQEMEWGGSGHKQADAVFEFANEIDAKAILDYGCGQGRLARALEERTPGWRIAEYDPGIPGKDEMPKPTHLVVASDVLEHVEPSKLDAVLGHIWALAGNGAYVVVATRPSGKLLPNGKNQHLIIETASWWTDKFAAQGWTFHRPPVRKDGHSIIMWLTK